MNRLLKIASCIAFTMMLASTSHAQILTPQGRLTLTSNTPVMTSDVVGTSTIYYTPYVGNTYADSNSTTFSNGTFTQMTLILDSTHHTAGNIYDVFIFCCGPGLTPVICAGPAWASLTSRGTGSGTSEINLFKGFWTNANSILNCYNNGSNNSFVANDALYVGSIYTTAAGETSVNIKPSPQAGGTGNVIGIWNAYNRVPIDSISQDSQGTWTDSTGSWEMADTNSNNRVTWVDGLGQSAVSARYADIASTNANVSAPYIGIDLDSTTATPNLWSAESIGTASGWTAWLTVEESFAPQYGLHYVQAMQDVGGPSPTVTFYGPNFQNLILHSEY